MFCSKCGKEIEDGASFCSECGTPTVFNRAQVNLRSGMNMNTQNDGMTNEEKTKKLAAIGSFVLAFVAEMFVVWSICATKWKIIFGSSIPDSSLERFWDDTSWVAVIAALMLTFERLMTSFRIYISAYINRSFAKFKKAGIGGFIWSLGILVIVPIIMSNYFYEKGGYYPVGLIALGVFACLLNIPAAITYWKAAECESLAQLENKAADRKSLVSRLSNMTEDNTSAPKNIWICPECGSRNSSLQNQCKDCGYYK